MDRSASPTVSIYNWQAISCSLNDPHVDVICRAGDSPSHFAKVSGPGHLVDMMLQLEARPETTLLCVNDDITVGEVETSVIFKYWANDHWGTPAQWEQGEYVPF